MESNYQREEVKRMRDNIGDLRGKLGDLENKNALLEKEVQNLNYQVRGCPRSRWRRMPEGTRFASSSTTINDSTRWPSTTATPPSAECARSARLWWVCAILPRSSHELRPPSHVWDDEGCCLNRLGIRSCCPLLKLMSTISSNVYYLQVAELQALLDTKQMLDAEIAIYRKMLEGEESR